MGYMDLNKKFWEQHLWARGYFVGSSGNVEIISEYIKSKNLQEKGKSVNLEIG